MLSNIQTFYKDKTIFVTGGSGFLGKVIIEKLLRCTEVKRIYVLIRPKRGQDVQERIAAWKDNAMFSLLHKTNAQCLERIVSIAGDCQEQDLGISEADRQLLAAEVQVVLHSAATVRFCEPLHQALDINTRATQLLLQLAKQMKQLLAFVHVSTAFSNCVIDHIDERYYPEHLVFSYDKVLLLRKQLSEEMLDSMTSSLLGKFPNTYTYTKALAEQVLQQEAGDLPLCIFRPGVIVGSYKEPVAGWIDNLYGPIAILYGAAFGILRVTRLNVNAAANIVPVDFCGNMVLASAWQTAVQQAERKQSAESAQQQQPPIYNYVPSNRNELSWGGFRDKAQLLANTYPLSQAMWLPFLHCTTTAWLFKFLAFFYHLLPGYAIDLVLWLRGQQPRMIRLYDKIHKNIELLVPFTNTSWKFGTHNTQRLWQCMSTQDKELFEFDMSTLDWDDYFQLALGGMRIYLAKEDPSPATLQRAQRLRARYYVLHRLLQFAVCSCGIALLWSLSKLLI
ncbi:fatty acyl-CoA reductase wat [Drosophila busckii]|nr:fatty acyl-CoA reductase wat [Drosophila busckii]